MIRYTLKEYLARINLAYLSVGGDKPPTVASLARETGLNYRTIARIANNEGHRMDFKTMTKIIRAIRKSGHEVSLHDLITLREEE